MNIIVLGAGVIGCYLGGRLAAAGAAVTLVGRPQVLEALADQGLTVTDLEGFQTHLAPGQLGLASSLAQAWSDTGTSTRAAVQHSAQTLVLLCVKGGGTAAAAAEIAALCPAGTVVISLQNGVDNVARIRSQAPRVEALAGMVPYNVVMRGVSQVHRATAGVLRLADHRATQDLLPLLTRAGLDTLLSRDMPSVQWGKLLLNLNNPINALAGIPLHAQLLDRNFRLVLAALQTEALMALKVAGIEPAQVASSPPRLLPHVLRLPNWLFTRLAARLLRMDTSARSSMWDDLQRGRVTEIDDLCGAVVGLARQQGRAAPVNTAITRLVKAYQPGNAAWSGVALRQALAL